MWPRLLAVLARNAQGQLRFLDASHVKSPSRRQQSRRWPTKSSHWTHQGRAEHQNQCVGGRARTGGEFELGPRTARQCVRRTDRRASAIAWHDHGGRQGLRQRRFSRAVAALGSHPCIPPRCNRLNPVGWHRGHYKKRHKVENLFQRLKRYRKIGTRYEKRDLYFLGFVSDGCNTGLAQKPILKTRPRNLISKKPPDCSSGMILVLDTYWR